MYRFPPKQQALVDGETIEYVVAGTGPATVVLVNGSGGPIEGWHKVFGPLAGVATVFGYNRPGIGGSSKPTVPQRGSHLVASLRGVLQAANLTPPYLLLGHSFGGLIVNLYARLHPAEVRAAILLEAAAPEDLMVLPVHETSVQRLLKRVMERLVPANPNAETQQTAAIAAEFQEAPAFPPIPLTVVTGGKPAMAWATKPEALAARAAHQERLVRLSPLGRHVVATGSGHFPQFSEPALVVAAVEEAIRLSR
jgi:pimeloyl-ACP methyl ester carboxylesterase